MFSNREKEIFNTLKELKSAEFVLIGGYAVNAYTLPRFSVDCDIVVRNYSELEKIKKLLAARGYKNVQPGIYADYAYKPAYAGDFLRYEKVLRPDFSVSVDIFLRNVTDRSTGVQFEAEWIFENSRSRKLVGKTIHEGLMLRIIDIGALVVMKIISCRNTDIRDIFMMLPNAKNNEWIRAEVQKRCNFENRIQRIIDKINSKQFKDGLAGVYGSIDQKVFEKHKQAVLNLA